MWIKTDYDELINTDRLSMIRYDMFSGKTIGYDGDVKIVVADFYAVPIIVNGLMHGSTILEVKK